MVDPDIFIKIQSLADEDRAAFLGFLGVEPTSEDELAKLLNALQARVTVKQFAGGTKPN